jgi:hypothetical protein
MLAGMIEALRGNMSEQGMFYYVSKDRSIEQPRRTYASAGSSLALRPAGVIRRRLASWR